MRVLHRERPIRLELVDDLGARRRGDEEDDRSDPAESPVPSAALPARAHGCSFAGVPTDARAFDAAIRSRRSWGRGP
jgi:hypothetical protein